MPTGGPNPNWNEAQKFEWYLGYLAQAARICGAASSQLTRLARMSPYGVIGLTQYRADGFYRAACVRYRAAIAEVLADAEEIENNIERTYECEDEGCYGQDLSDWQFHTCGNSLKSHVAILGIEYEDVREVTLLDPAKLGSSAAYPARIQFHSCQGFALHRPQPAVHHAKDADPRSLRD